MLQWPISIMLPLTTPLLTSFLIKESGQPNAPTTFLYYQASELYLKAFLRLKGDSARRLWWLGHNVQKLRSRAIRRGLVLGQPENDVLDWMEQTEAWNRSRYIETGSTWRPAPRDLIQMGCSNIRTAVAAAFQEAGHVVRLMQQLKLQLPLYNPLDPRS